MQQVAANKTDIAALPFSASSTAKAVGSGLDSHAQGQNSDAFNRLYQEAKNAGRDFVLNGNSANLEKGSPPVHTNLPKNDDEPSNSTHPLSQSPSHKKLGTSDGTDSLSPSNEGISIVQEQKGLSIDKEESLVIGPVIDKQIIIGPDGKKVLSEPVTGEPAPEPDWIALVEGITKNGFGQTASDSSTQVGSDEGIGSTSNSTQAMNAEGLDDSNGVIDAVSELMSQLQSMKENDVASNQTLADKLTALSHLLNKQIENTDAKDATENESTDTLSELLAVLTGSESSESSESSEGQEGGNLGGANLVNAISEDARSEERAQEAFILSLAQDALSTVTNDRLSNALSIDNAGETATVQIGSNIDRLHEELTDADVLDVDVPAQTTSDLEAEQNLLTAVQQEASTKIAASAAVVNGESANLPSAASAPNKDGDNSVANLEAATLSDESLLMAINKLPPETAQKATEAFAERMVALVPNSQQQQAVKTNIIAGINEFQKQVEQGHQPGIDLSAIVADAAKDAALSSDVSAALNSRVDAQAGQFMQLMNNAQSSIHQIVQNQLAQVDTTINENSQIRSESSKLQQQFEGFDKAVNIHKPEGQQQLNEKIRWMVNARNTMAEIRLDPPELGSMQVRVNVQGDAASVSFIVQSQQAKDALADTMPKLRDMLSDQGIELGDAQVRKDNSQNGESGQQLAGQSGSGQAQRGNNDAEFGDDTRVIEQAVTREAKGGIDYYA
ncbi:flagellar hook-length control protein FliK [Alteromonas sp. BMJM2]|uniref:flagellar hook-length control protein FliK n=1 Tax=Alteromonas sp. BMJM2 TaxID=2954241 RepID=UPI0022B516B8|nr:flagellar hook-length control protein FliK [Alteromonas sp. BMJM2]